MEKRTRGGAKGRKKVTGGGKEKEKEEGGKRRNRMYDEKLAITKEKTIIET